MRPYEARSRGDAVTWRFEDGTTIEWDRASRRRLWPSRLHRLALPETRGAAESELGRRLERVAAERGPVHALGAWSEATRARHLPEDAVDAVRWALATATPAEYAAARDHARASAASFGEAPRRVAYLAAALTAEEEWTHACARAWIDGAMRDLRALASVGAFVTAPALATELARASVAQPRGPGRRPHDLVAHLGPDAVPALRELVLERWSDRSATEAVRALCRIGSEPAGRLLVPLFAVRAFRADVGRWAKRHPTRARAIAETLRADPSDEALDLAAAPSIAADLDVLLQRLGARPAPLPSRLPSGPDDALTAAMRDEARAPSPPPSFLVFDRLPPLARRDGAPVPVEASRALVSALRRGDAAAMDGLRRCCEPGSLRRLALAIFEVWLEQTAEPGHGWVLEGLHRLGDDALLPALLPYVDAWHARGSHRRVERLLGAIAELGPGPGDADDSLRALRELDRLAHDAPPAALRRAARAAFEAAASRRGLSAEQLEDRVAPRFGFDERGVGSLAIGARRLRVQLDDVCRPRIGRGRRFPKRRVADDPEAHAAARGRFLTLSRELARALEAQRRRLERAMIHERRFRLAELLRFVVRHPVLRRVADGLVWGEWVDGALGRTFRIASDASLRDLDDDPLAERDPDAAIVLAHPLQLSFAQRAAWADRLAEHELVPPFAQLARPTFALPGVDLELEGAETDWRALARLAEGALERTLAPSGVRVTAFRFEVAERFEVRLEVEPGLHVGHPYGSGRQRVVRAYAEGADSPISRSEARLSLAPLFE